METRHADWSLDSRLQADTFPLFEDEHRCLLLMNDSRWPWLIAVPKIAGAVELHDLDRSRMHGEMEFSANIGERLKTMTDCEKINIAAIGNMVRQLHIHIIARSPGDTNWPGPVWGFGDAIPYTKPDADALIEQLKVHILAPLIS